MNSKFSRRSIWGEDHMLCLDELLLLLFNLLCDAGGQDTAVDGVGHVFNKLSTVVALQHTKKTKHLDIAL